MHSWLPIMLTASGVQRQRVKGISDLIMGSPAQTGLTYQTQCRGFAVGYERLRHPCLMIKPQTLAHVCS